MINTGTTADLLEKNQTTYQEQKRNSDSVTYQRDVSVSNDLMRNYADKGLFIEQHLADTEVNDTNVNVNAGVDTNPSETTLQFTFDNADFEDEDEQQNKSSYKISAKGKIMIVVYALVVATIIALIAVNASVLRSMQENIHAKEDAVIELKTQTQTLKEELEEVSSEETIIKKAMEMGMTK